MALSARRGVGLGFTIAAVVVGLWFLNPAAMPFCPRCPLYSFTGIYCPGCGSTRALHQLAHGHVFAAFRLNAMMVSALPLVSVLLLRRPSVTLRAGWIWTLLVVVVAFGVMRNLPWYPFTLLAPQP